MNYDTKSLRKKRGISLDLPLHYRSIWLARKSSIIQMIECDIAQKNIAAHYNVTPAALASAMTYHKIRALNIRYNYKKSQAITAL